MKKEKHISGENQEQLNDEKEHQEHHKHHTAGSDERKSSHASHTHHIARKEEKNLNKPVIIIMLIIAGALIIFNQFQIGSVYAMTSGGKSLGFGKMTNSGTSDLSKVDVDSLQSTAQTLAAIFPELSGAQTSEEIIGIIFPTGTPDYGNDLGVSFDEPIKSLDTLSKMFKSLKAEVESKNPEAFSRYVNLASNPKGVSCEYCCGVGPIGADSKGNSRCGCQHNPALLSVTLYLTAYTDYTDAEILREVMKWKTLFFPKNMVDLGTKISGGDASVLKDLPGMVGGC